MAEDLNIVAQNGRLTRDAELKYTSGGIPVCKFSIAVNKRRKIGNEWSLYPSFFDCVLWGPLGESLHKYLVRGKLVGIRGELHQNRWEQEGQNRSKVEILIENIYLLPGGRSQENSGNTHNEYQGPQDCDEDVTF